jgi:hypothetical protein
MTPPPLPVTFRRQRSGPFKGSVTAVFPTLPECYTGGAMVCWSPSEGHGGASLNWYRDSTRPATESEYADTLAALRRLYEDPGATLRLQPGPVFTPLGGFAA